MEDLGSGGLSRVSIQLNVGWRWESKGGSGGGRACSGKWDKPSGNDFQEGSPRVRGFWGVEVEIAKVLL